MSERNRVAHEHEARVRGADPEVVVLVQRQTLVESRDAFDYGASEHRHDEH